MPNIFTAGRDALLEDLAQRDAAQRLQEDRARQVSLDAENKAYRDRQLGLQERQLDSVDQDRDERRRAASDQRGVAAMNDAATQHDLRLVMDPNAPVSEKRAAALRLDLKGVDPKALSLAIDGPPKPEVQEVWRTNPRTGKLERMGEVPKGAHFINEPAPAAGPAGAKDDPRLPNGVKTWIDSIATRGVDLGTARSELSRGFGQQKQVHPNADLAEASAYLTKLFPNNGGVPEALGAGAPLPAAAAPSPAPAPAPAAGPAAAAAPTAGPDDAAAVAELTRRGKPVTPDTIKMAKAILAQEGGNAAPVEAPTGDLTVDLDPSRPMAEPAFGDAPLPTGGGLQSRQPTPFNSPRFVPDPGARRLEDAAKQLLISKKIPISPAALQSAVDYLKKTQGF